MNYLGKILALFLLLLSCITAHADPQVAIIVNSQNTQAISLQDISNIYNDRITTWANNQKIDVYNLPTASPTREVFSRALLGMSAMAAAANEANRHITNTSRNSQHVKRERLVMLSVATNRNAIGYVRASSITQHKDIKVLFYIK